MTRQQAGVSAEAFADEMVDKLGWKLLAMCKARGGAANGTLTWPEINAAIDEIDAEIEAHRTALATAPPEQATAARVEVCGMCGGFLQGDYCPACDATVDEDARDTVPVPPEAASGGALYADELRRQGYRIGWKALANLIRAYFSDFDDTHVMQWAEGLAAHDQKVRAEVLETALEAVGGATDLLQAYAPVRSLASGAVERRSEMVTLNECEVRTLIYAIGLLLSNVTWTFAYVHMKTQKAAPAPAASKPEAADE